MAVDEKNGWKRFQRLRFDSKRFSRRAKQAETATTKHARKFVLERLAGIRDVRNHIIRWMVLIVILLAAIGLQMVWFQKTYQTEAAVAGGTYAEGVLGPIETLNPLYATSSAERSVSRLVFSSLFTYDTTGHLRDDLATNISVDKSGKTYTVTLRPNVKWQDGSRLTAEDVVFTVNLMKNPETRAVMGVNWQQIDARAVDERTVEFMLPAPYAAFRHALTFAVLPEHILSDVNPGSLRESTFSLSPIGSGPFMLQLLQNVSSHDDRKIVHLVPWGDYYGGTPKVGRLELHSYPSPNDIIRALKTGDVNAATDISGATRRLPSRAKQEAVPTNSGVYAILNTTAPLLKDKHIRQALQRGTDTATLRQAVTPHSPALDLPFVDDQLSGDDMPTKPGYNIAVAKHVLDKAGWKLRPDEAVRHKGKTKLELTIATIDDPLYKKTVKQLEQQWQRLGIGVIIKVYDPDNVQQNFVQTVLQARNYDVLVYELDIGADPDVFAYWHSSQVTASGRNFANYQDKISDDILVSARGRSSAALRNEKYKAFAEQWLDDVPAIGLYRSVMMYAHNPQTTALSKGMSLVSATDRYANVLYWTADRGQVYKTP